MMEDMDMARTDGHYCLIKFLAHKAGLAVFEAELVAYASELVDHATDHKEIYIEGLPAKFQRLLRENGCFNPVCTAHVGIAYADFLFNKLALEKVLISFHFLPPKFYKGAEFDYVISPESELFDSLLQSTLAEIEKAETGDDHVLSLIRLGILLHTLLDMYTHAGFSGRHHIENDVENLIVNGEIGDQEIGIIPDIGHGELQNFPDISSVIFSYDDYLGQRIIRNNPEIFMQVARRIYGIFCRISLGSQTLFSEFEEELRLCFTFPSQELEEVIEFWKKQFPGINFNFKPEAWKWQAIEKIPVDSVVMARHQVSEAYRYKGETRSVLWFLFHQAAAEQREFVRRHIKRL